jgi:hypothetical protein
MGHLFGPKVQTKFRIVWMLYTSSKIYRTVGHVTANGAQAGDALPICLTFDKNSPKLVWNCVKNSWAPKSVISGWVHKHMTSLIDMYVGRAQISVLSPPWCTITNTHNGNIECVF